MSIDVVVVLPWVPATPIERAWAQIAASIPARRSVGMPRSRAARSSMFVSGIAVEDVTASHPSTRSASWPTRTSTPAARTRSSTGWSRTSLPDTAWPISARAMAIADIPGPPTPTTCRRSGRDRSSGARGASVGRTAVTVGQARRCDRRLTGHPRRPSATALDELDERAAAVLVAGPRAAARAELRRASSSARRRSISVAERASSAPGAARPRPGRRASARSRVWWSSAAPRPRHEDRRRAGDGHLGDRARPAAPDEQVGGRCRGPRSPVVVADDLVQHAGAVADDRRRRRGSARRRPGARPGRASSACARDVGDDGRR